MHGMRTVLGHAQCIKVGEEEVHLGRSFGFGCELIDNAHAVDHHFFARIGDVSIWCNKSVRPDRY